MERDLIGTWRIVEMDVWDLDAIELVWPALMQVHSDGHGEFGFIARATAPGPDGTTIQVIGIDDENIDTSIETIDLAAFAYKMNQRERRAATGATDTSLPT